MLIDSCSGKVQLVIERYLERMLEPQVIEEANLAQITKTLEMLLERLPEFGQAETAQIQEDPVSAALRALAEEMEKEIQGGS